jgi:hypothetical protein
MAAAVATPVAVVAAPATRPAARVAGPREEVTNHPDGTLATKARLNAAGERHGDFVAYFPGGKKIQERSRYQNGKLHGPRTVYNEQGKVEADEAWVDGRLLFPKSIKQIEAMRTQIRNDVIAYFKANPPKVPAGGPSIDSFGEALVRVRWYRYLADVATDVGLNDEYIDLCQHGAELMAKLNQLTHTPSRPDGVSDEFYQKGKAGCGSSNIFTGSNIAASVDAYMDDSDRSNIDRLGHRRWVLNPKMLNTGFGAGPGKYSAMYSFDGKRQETPDYDLVTFPSRGYHPMTEFRPHMAWHVSFNPAKYSVSRDAKMAIYALDGSLKRIGGPLELDYRNVNLDGFGISNAVIGRPKTLPLRKGAMFEVVITGVTPKDSSANKEISYVVAFY